MNLRWITKGSAFILLGTTLPFGQPTYPGCDNLATSQFTYTELFNKKGTPTALTTDAGLAEPVQMDLRGVYKGDSLDHVDVYFVERMGKVKYYDGAAKKVTTMATISVHGKDDNGLFGIQVSPTFETDRLLYLWYTPPAGNQNRHLRLTRVKVKTDNTLDMATEKILIDVLGSKSDMWHSGGPMQFDAYGDLWIAIGNNSPDVNTSPFPHYSKTDSTTTAEWGPSNTASMRGGFIRIHPDNSEKGYSIPAGNFGEYWAAEFEKKGNATLAAQYRDPKKVLPEIYVKGTRSNFSIAVHPTKRWLAWGEVNYATTNDEVNIVGTPSFTGFPYFHGPSSSRVIGQQETMGFLQDSTAPRNVSPFNSGVETLPPARGAKITNLVNVIIGGPIYLFNPNLKNKTKFPPHFHNNWFTHGFNGGIWLHQLDTVNIGISKTTRIEGTFFSGVKVRNHVQSRFGPDGSLYILNYSGYYSTDNPGVARVDYVGNCYEYVPPVSNGARSFGMPDSYYGIRYVQGAWTVTSPESHRFEVTDLKGHVLYSQQGKTGARYALDAIPSKQHLPQGLLMVRITTSQGTYSKTVSRL